MPRQRQRASGTPAASGRPESGLRRSRLGELQRARLLSAMLEVCAERGAANVTVADVVGRAGVSRRTFYELFNDCESCLLAALDRALDTVSERVVAAYGSSSLGLAPWRERMRAGLLALLESFDDEPLVAHLLVVDSLGAGPRVFDRRVRALAPLIAAVDEGRSATLMTTATSLTAEGTVGAVLSVIHSRVVQGRQEPLRGLVNELMSMVVLPYLGPAAARRELHRHLPARARTQASPAREVLKGLEIRVTYRTMNVLMAIANSPGASNRQIARAAGIDDQGQISKLLARLRQRGLIENGISPQLRGTPNAWRLTARGEQVSQALDARGEYR